MTQPGSNLKEIKEFLVAHQHVTEFRFLRERVTSGSTYVRARLTLTNGGILHFTEYGEVDVAGNSRIVTYTYQWMTADGKLIRRWDNAFHYPHLPNFPHHLHDGDEKNVLPSEPMNLFKVLDVIATELDK
jgi:hypothetical protein